MTLATRIICAAWILWAFIITGAMIGREPDPPEVCHYVRSCHVLD